MIEQIFTIHPVGQGFFYSCKLSIENKVRFRMVFDCGSLTAKAGQAEVDEYRKDPDYLKEKVLDLLVLSHFDADHINHIKRLLQGVKIKRLVMPFISFEERLFLSIRYVTELPDGDNPDGIVDFIINPLSALSEHLDNDSEIFLVDSTDEPILGPDNESNDVAEMKTDARAEFEMNGKGETLTADEIKETELLVGSFKVFKIWDSNKGLARQGIYAQLMEFLFYKRTIGHAEYMFFNGLRSLFDSRYIKGSNELDKKEYLDAVIAAIKTMPSAKKWKPLIDKVVKELGGKVGMKELGIDFSKSELRNLNTTALCMIHKNSKGLYSLGSIDKDNRFYFFDLHSIQKFGTASVPRVEALLNHKRYSHLRRYLHFKELFIRKYPNTLLTSDIFLLKKEDVDSLLSKYRNHWNSFWMIQVPHHGSKNNSNRIFLSQIPQETSLFINYGTLNRDKHPDTETINDIVTTGHSSKLVSVNEFTGLKFSLKGP